MRSSRVRACLTGGWRRRPSRRASPSCATHDIAHRGLWGRGVPENSLAAAAAAIGGGFAIECDVRLSRDGTVIVFHDADTRAADAAGRAGSRD